MLERSGSNKVEILPKELMAVKIDIAVLLVRKGKGEEVTGKYLYFWSGVGVNKHAKAGVSVTKYVISQKGNCFQRIIFYTQMSNVTI